jgi:hypothetical protein
MMISSQPLTFEILRSVDSGVAPHHRSPASATEPAGQDLWASSLPERATVPLQSRANASPFWIMLLLSSGTFEREIIEVERRDHLLARFLISANWTAWKAWGDD